MNGDASANILYMFEPMDLKPKLLRAFLAIFDSPTISEAARTAGHVR